MANKEMTADECMEIFKKYDKSLYDFYNSNMYFFGCDAKNYAQYLKQKHEAFNRIIERLNEMDYRFEILNNNPEKFSILVYDKHGNGSYTTITPSDDKRENYFCIEGIVQNFEEWLMKG